LILDFDKPFRSRPKLRLIEERWPDSTFTYRQNPAQHCQRVGIAHTVDPGILLRGTFAMYAVAFSRISTSILSRPFSALSRNNSICPGVIGLPPLVPSFPALAFALDLPNHFLLEFLRVTLPGRLVRSYLQSPV
jgi:hypothetical protein